MVFRELEDGTIVSRVKSIPDVIKIRLNDEEKKRLVQAAHVLNQTKHSTAMKQLALSIGANVVLEGFIGRILNEITENKRKNERTGYDAEFM